MSGLGGRAHVLGEDRWGQTFFTLGAHSPVVYVTGPAERVNAAPRRAGPAAAAAAAAAAASAGSPGSSPAAHSSMTAAAAVSASGRQLSGAFSPGALGLGSRGGVGSAASSSSAGDLRRRLVTVPGGALSALRPAASPSLALNPGAAAEAAARRACTLRPDEWAVYDSPQALAALIQSLHPLGRSEGPLRQALQRREPLLRVAMAAAAESAVGARDAPKAAAAATAALMDDGPPSGAAAAATSLEHQQQPPGSSCALCAQALPSAEAPQAADASAAAAPFQALHCFVCHVTLPVGTAAAPAARALFASHVRRCWDAAAHAPVRRAAALVCARAATEPRRRRPAAADIRAAAAATGASVADVAAAFDATLAQLKRQAVCLAEAVDWALLRHPATWPPAARAAWVGAVLAAPSGGELLQLLHVLVRALYADDAAAAATASATAPLRLQKEGARKRSPAECAVLAAAASTQDPEARPGSLRWRWLEPWFADRTPSAEASAGLHSTAAAAWTLRAVAAALQPHLIGRAAPPPLPNGAL